MIAGLASRFLFAFASRIDDVEDAIVTASQRVRRVRVRVFDAAWELRRRSES